MDSYELRGYLAALTFGQSQDGRDVKNIKYRFMLSNWDCLLYDPLAW